MPVRGLRRHAASRSDYPRPADGDAHASVGLIMYRYELFHPDIGTYYAHFGFCTGTLVAPDLLLTAAHCVYTEEPNLPILWVSFDT